MEFLHAINQSLFLFVNADPDDHPGAIVIALLIAEYLTAITLAAVAVYLVWKHRRRRVVWLNVLCSLLLGMAATYLIRKGWHVPRPFDMQLGTKFFGTQRHFVFPQQTHDFAGCPADEHVPVCPNSAGGRGRFDGGNERGVVEGVSGRALAAGYDRGAAGGFAGGFSRKVWLAPVVDALA